VFYPNRRQWWVIWIIYPLASFIWIGAAEGAGRTQDDRFALALLGFGALLVWRFARKP
jgi:hypothetical protein